MILPQSRTPPGQAKSKLPPNQARIRDGTDAFLSVTVTFRDPESLGADCCMTFSSCSPSFSGTTERALLFTASLSHTGPRIRGGSLANTLIVMGDLVLTEILQGFQIDKDFETAKDLLSALPFITMGGRDLSIQSAINYRKLRKKGVTVGKTIGVIIGTFCIYNQRCRCCMTIGILIPWQSFWI